MLPMALSRWVTALGLAVDLLFPRERAREVRCGVQRGPVRGAVRGAVTVCGDACFGASLGVVAVLVTNCHG